jgi:DNA-directed RNA polymerase subunit beta'
MLRLLNPSTFSKNLNPVLSMINTTKTGEFHTEGLFSENIFGPLGSPDRRIVFAYIELHGFVIHPSVYRVLMQLDRKIEKFISTDESFILDEDGRLEISSKGVTGIKEFIKLFPKINWRGETDLRNKLIKFVKRETKAGTIFVDKIIVIPPDLRPAVQGEDGSWMIDTLNDVYISVMRRASQLRSSGSGPLYDLLNYALQQSVMEHDNFIRAKIGKKHGIIREQMLGKRIDFSGRAVITPDPHIKINEVGVPLRLAIGLFEPFIMHRLLYSGRVDRDVLANGIKEYTGMELSVEAVKRVMKGIKEGDKIPDDLYELFFEQTEISMIDRIVIVKRDPVLHTQSYLAYYPVLHRGDTLLMSTTQVGVHNADFDGDTMAIYHPLTNEAQQEAKLRMMKLTSGTTSSEFIFGLSKEMWAGLYTISKDKNPKGSPIAVTNEDVDNATDPYIAVKYRGNRTTMGKAVINSCFPKDMGFMNAQATKKTIGARVEATYNKHGDDTIKLVVDKLKDVGFKWATIMAPSMNLDSFILPASVIKIKEKIKGASPEEAQDLIEEAQKILQNHLDDSGFGDLANSGSTKGWSQPMQILVAKGVIADPDGNVLDPISGSFADGLTNREFFDASQGARKGIIDRVINTADTGYMSRKLAYLLNTVELDRQVKDCKTKRTLDVKLDDILIQRFTGRYVIKKGKLMLFEDAKFKVGDIASFRTPIYCESEKICHTCYGKLLERHQTPYVGILAAQIIGERGTQLIMKTFHTGGAVSLIKRDMLEDIINNDPMSGLEK